MSTNLLSAVAAVVLGFVFVLSFAPFSLWWLAFVCLTSLFILVVYTPSPIKAAQVGFCFGLAFFASGLWWVFQALSGYIGLPPFLAFPLWLLLCAFLAMFPATAVYLAKHAGGQLPALLAVAACWVLSEWLRAHLFTGFPWLAAGYSQIPNSPLAGYAPILGINGVTLMLTLSAALIASSVLPNVLIWRRVIAVISTVAIIASGGYLQHIQWTTVIGKTTVSVLQGNVEQNLKWRKGQVAKALTDYLRMAEESSGKIIIMPETALPMHLDELPTGYMQSLEDIATARDGALITGIFLNDTATNETDKEILYNGAIAIGDFPPAYYHKRHLTPYGEYLPFEDILRPILLRADIPFNSLSSGTINQPMQLGKTKMAIAICYEDAFGDEWLEQMATAQFMANLVNEGWFDGSIMASQHLQISQARAVEAGKWLVRSTNTGISAVIDDKGKIRAILPAETQGILSHELDLLNGTTPYTMFGDKLVLLFSLLLLIVIIIKHAISIWRR